MLFFSRSYTKDEKEQENNKRNSPTKNASIGRGRQESADNSQSARAIREMIRHHLERTTGGSGM